MHAHHPQIAKAGDWRDHQRKYWDNMATTYDRLYRSRWNVLEDADTCACLASLLPSYKSRILDLGCGTGLGISMLASTQKEFDYFGLDLSSAMLNLLAAKYPERKKQLIAGKMSDLSQFTDNFFDGVTSFYTAFSFTDYFQRTLNEVARVTAPGGFVFISVLSRFSLRRIIRFHCATIENFSTRGAPDTAGSTPAWTLSAINLKNRFERAGLYVDSIRGQSILGGVCESAAFWRADKLLACRFPQIAHTLNVTAHAITQ